MKIVISPAKSIDYKELQLKEGFSTGVFLKEAESLASKLKKVSAKKFEQMMHISRDLAEMNYLRYQKWETPMQSTENNFPCVAGFNGEAYRGLDAWSMSGEDLKKAQEKLRILSGLYGLLRPLDLMYPYRLEMGTKWEISPKIRNLYAFWGKKLAQQLNTEMREGEVLINLASTEYFKAIDQKTLKARVITPVFKDFKNGELKTIMVFAKHQRGAMARYIITNNIENEEALKLYDQDGYSFDVNSSSENEWVFVRN